MIDIKDKLHNEIKEYCKFNNIEDVSGFINKCLQAGFNIQKYGMIGQKESPPITEPPKEQNAEEAPQIEKKPSQTTTDDYSVYDN